MEMFCFCFNHWGLKCCFSVYEDDVGECSLSNVGSCDSLEVARNYSGLKTLFWEQEHG